MAEHMLPVHRAAQRAMVLSPVKRVTLVNLVAKVKKFLSDYVGQAFLWVDNSSKVNRVTAALPPKRTLL
jgi:hypothetical protein